MSDADVTVSAASVELGFIASGKRVVISFAASGEIGGRITCIRNGEPDRRQRPRPGCAGSGRSRHIRIDSFARVTDGFPFFSLTKRRQMTEFRGIYPALITPMTREGDFNEDAFRRLLEFNIQSGAHGFWGCRGRR